MLGQGYRLALAKLIAEKAGREFSDEMKIGTLILDSLTISSGGRRFSHFCGGAGCVLPKLEELESIFPLQTWDSGIKKSFLVDPEIDIMLAKYATAHIPESDYKDGLIIHLLIDKYYDELIQKKLFNFSGQDHGIVYDRKNGYVMDNKLFKKELDDTYPMLDQYALELASISKEDIEETKKLLKRTIQPQHADFICEHLNFDEKLVWTDTIFFTKELIDAHIKDAVFSASMHIIKSH